MWPLLGREVASRFGFCETGQQCVIILRVIIGGSYVPRHANTTHHLSLEYYSPTRMVESGTKQSHLRRTTTTTTAMILLSTALWSTRHITPTLAFLTNSHSFTKRRNIMNENVAMLPTQNRRRLVVDTDAGFDDVVAIQSLLAHGLSIDLVTTVCGSNTSVDTWQGLQRLFPHLEIVPSSNRPRPTQAWLTDFRRHNF